MATPRQTATEFIAKYFKKLLPGAEQDRFIREALDAMDEKTFKAYMEDLASGQEILPLTVPNLEKEVGRKLSIERNLAVGKELGHDFFVHLRLTDQDTGKVYTTPEKYLVGLIPVRRQRQLQRKKITIPEGTRHVDELSGQVTGPSKGAKISLPELQILYSQDLNDPLIELIKYRGGDVQGQRMLYESLMETGHASLKAIGRFPTKVKSTQTLGVILHAMMLKNTL